MAKDKQAIVEQDPPAGGSYIRNTDGSLTKQAPADETAPATPATDAPIETKD